MVSKEYDGASMVTVSVAAETKKGEYVQEQVDEDICRFNLWFKEKLHNSDLTGSEKSIIKTYLWWKLYEDGGSVQESTKEGAKEGEE